MKIKNTLMGCENIIVIDEDNIVSTELVAPYLFLNNGGKKIEYFSTVDYDYTMFANSEIVKKRIWHDMDLALDLGHFRKNVLVNIASNDKEFEAALTSALTELEKTFFFISINNGKTSPLKALETYLKIHKYYKGWGEANTLFVLNGFSEGFNLPWKNKISTKHLKFIHFNTQKTQSYIDAANEFQRLCVECVDLDISSIKNTNTKAIGSMGNFVDSLIYSKFQEINKFILNN